MTRRVIFPPPDYWTNKETPMTDNTTPRDIRMAAVLIKHHIIGDTTGMHEIVRETVDTDRATPLLAAVLDLHAMFVDQTRTEIGLAYFAECIRAIGNFEPTTADEQDQRNAVTVIDGHGRGDFDAINTVLTAVREYGRGTQLILQILGVFRATIPELSTAAGISWLDATIASIISSGREAQP